MSRSYRFISHYSLFVIPLWPYAVIIGLTLLFFYKLAFTGMILARGDMYAYFYPYWSVRNAALMAGQIPLWTPDIFMGVPLLANSQIGLFYPPNWLVTPLDAPTAITISLLLHVAWALLGAYRLARVTLGLDQLPALLAAAIFGLSGYMGAKVENINQFQALAWMPWLFLLLNRALQTPPAISFRDWFVGLRRQMLKPSGYRIDKPTKGAGQTGRYVLLLGVGLALQLLAGHPQTVFISGLGLGIYGVVVAFASIERPSGMRTKYISSLQPYFRAISRALLILTCAGIIALILASPQIIPTLELIQSSNRSGGLNPQQAMAFSLNPWIIGRGMLPSYDSLLFGEYMAYIGVIGLGLALVGVFNGYPKRRRLKSPGYQKDKPTKGAETQIESDELLRSENQAIGLMGYNGDKTLNWARQVNRLPWIVLAVVGFGLALGLYNPLYWTLASLPGFSFFRVPARWLALFALGAAMLAGIGLQSLHIKRPAWWMFVLIAGLIGGLARASFLADVMAMDVIGPAEPTMRTLIGWAMAAGVLLIGLRFAASSQSLYPTPQPPPRIQGGGGRRMRWRRYAVSLLGILAIVELFAASRVLAYNEVAPPDTFNAQRFTISQLRAYAAEQTPPGRVLSISQALFDPGDIEALTARYRALGMSDLAIRIALVDTKLRDLLAANLPLAWGVPSVDGFDGGLLPSGDYSAFTSLMLPPGEERSVDGRLREMMAQAECRGACIPEQRWLNLSNTRYLITDKTADLVKDSVFYDTSLTYTLSESVNFETSGVDVDPPFIATAIDILYSADACVPSTACIPLLGNGPPAKTEPFDAFMLARWELPNAEAVSRLSLRSQQTVKIHAITLIDTRTGDFQQVSLPPWKRVLSSDIKLYENLNVTPRAYYVVDHSVQIAKDTESGLEMLRQYDAGIGDFTPAVVIPNYVQRNSSRLPTDPRIEVKILDYTPERIEIAVNAGSQAGLVVLTDAYYPGWVATVNGEPAKIHRTNIMFRGVAVPEGESTLVFEYKPAWWPGILVLGAAAWLAALVAGVMIRKFRVPSSKF